MGDSKSAKVLHLVNKSNRTFKTYGERKLSKSEKLKKNVEKDVCKTVIKNNSGGVQTWYKPKVEEEKAPKRADETAPRPSAIPIPKNLISNKTRRPASSGRKHTSINRKRGNAFLSKARKMTKLTTLTTQPKADDTLANAETNFSSNSNKNFSAGSSTAIVAPARKMPIRKQNYSFINEMFEKNKSKTRHLNQNDLQLQTHSIPNFVVQKSKQSISKIPLFKDTKVDKSQAQRRKSSPQIKDLKAKKTESLRALRKPPHETTRCAVLSDLNQHTSNRSSAKRSGKQEEIIYCAICSLLEQIEYHDPDECLQVIPATEFDQARAKFLADHKHLHDRYASKFENKMVIAAGQLTDLVYLDNLKTKNDFKHIKKQQRQPKVASQKRFCLTRLYSPISSEQQTIDDKILKHNAKLEEPRSKVSQVSRRMDSGDDDDDDRSYTPPLPVKKELWEHYSNKSKFKSNRHTNRKHSPAKVAPTSPTRSLNSESSESRLHDKNLKYLMRELELLKIKGLLSDDDYDDDVKNASNVSQKQQGKVKHSRSIKGHINKNLNAKRGERDDSSFENENKKKNFHKIIKRFVSECLSPSMSNKNAVDEASPNTLKECKPFIFGFSRYAGGEDMSTPPGVPLENRLHHLLSSGTSKEPPSQSIEIPPYRSVKDFLQMPPKFFTNTDLPFNTNTENNNSNLSHNNNVKFPVSTESSPWGEYLNVVEHLERKKQRKKTSSEVLRIAWNSLNFGESFCSKCKQFPSNIFGKRSSIPYTDNSRFDLY